MAGIEFLQDKNLRIAVYSRYADKRSDGIRSPAELYLERIRKEIDSNPNWTFVGAYIDYDMSDWYSCPESKLQDLLTDCREGKIDAVYVRSISRFARNIRNVLDIVDELSRLESPVGVFFETENLFTLDENNNLCEFMKLLPELIKKAEEESRIKAKTAGCLYGSVNRSRYCGTKTKGLSAIRNMKSSCGQKNTHTR